MSRNDKFLHWFTANTLLVLAGFALLLLSARGCRDSERTIISKAELNRLRTAEAAYAKHIRMDVWRQEP